MRRNCGNILYGSISGCVCLALNRFLSIFILFCLMNTDELRAGKLFKFLEAIINGKQPLTARSSARFFEAICAQLNAATCISMLISSTQGIECVQTAMRFDLTPTFFNGPATDFLKYISSPNLTNIGGGAFLTKIIVAIVEPPIFWSPFWS